MEVAKIFLNNIPGRKCSAWVFRGDYWTEETKEQVNQVMRRHIEDYIQPSGYNTWIFYRLESGVISIERLTWNRLSWCKDLGEFEKFMERYYVW